MKNNRFLHYGFCILPLLVMLFLGPFCACSGLGTVVQNPSDSLSAGTPRTNGAPPSVEPPPSTAVILEKKTFSQPVIVDFPKSVVLLFNQALAYNGSEALIIWNDPLGGFVEFPPLMFAFIDASVPTVSTLSPSPTIPEHLCNVRTAGSSAGEIHLITININLSQSYYSVSSDNGKLWLPTVSIPNLADCGQMTIVGQDAFSFQQRTRV